MIGFVLQQQGHSWADYGRQVREAGYDAYAGFRRLTDGDAAAAAVDAITGRATPFLRSLDDWRPHAGLVPRCLDQAIATLKQFSSAVKQPIEALEAKHIQAWVDALMTPNGDAGISAKTVNRKLSELRNYWRYLQSIAVVAEDRLPFDHRRVKDPPHRRKTKEELGSGSKHRTSFVCGTRPNYEVTSSCRMRSELPPTAEHVSKVRAS